MEKRATRIQSSWVRGHGLKHVGQKGVVEYKNLAPAESKTAQEIGIPPDPRSKMEWRSQRHWKENTSWARDQGGKGQGSAAEYIA